MKTVSATLKIPDGYEVVAILKAPIPRQTGQVVGYPPAAFVECIYGPRCHLFAPGDTPWVAFIRKPKP